MVVSLSLLSAIKDRNDQAKSTMRFLSVVYILAKAMMGQRIRIRETPIDRGDRIGIHENPIETGHRIGFREHPIDRGNRIGIREDPIDRGDLIRIHIRQMVGLPHPCLCLIVYGQLQKF